MILFDKKTRRFRGERGRFVSMRRGLASSTARASYRRVYPRRAFPPIPKKPRKRIPQHLGIPSFPTGTTHGFEEVPIFVIPGVVHETLDVDVEDFDRIELSDFWAPLEEDLDTNDPYPEV